MLQRRRNVASTFLSPPRTRSKRSSAIALDLNVTSHRRSAENAYFGSGRRSVLFILAGLPLAGSVSNGILQAVHEGRELIAGRAKMRGEDGASPTMVLHRARPGLLCGRKRMVLPLLGRRPPLPRKK